EYPRPERTRTGGPSMRVVLILAVLVVCGAAPVGAAPSTNAAASAWDVSDNHSGSTPVSASASKQGSPGSSSGVASTRFGNLVTWATMKGCVLQFPLFQQLCNQATGQSDYSEQIHVVSDAPDGTPVQVQVSYVVSGRLVGTGVYSYDTHAVANSTTIPGTN